MLRKIAERQSFDFPIFFVSIVLWIIGVALVYSATHLQTTGPLASVSRNQVVWVFLGTSIILLIVSIPTRFYYSFAYVFYVMSLLMLVVVIFTGYVSKGAGRWIDLGPMRIQPSEFAKIGLLLVLARYFSQKNVSLDKLSTFFLPGLLIGVPFVLVLKQPDLSTALVFCAMSLPMFYWAGLSLLEVFFLISPCISIVLSAIPLILNYGSQNSLGFTGTIPWGLFFGVLCTILYLSRPRLYITIGVVSANLIGAAATAVLWNGFLQDYQKIRIISVIDPQKDPFGAGYQVIQSKVAIGSGHIFGKGYLQGSQTRLAFLPEQHTDFIFSVLGEQFGLLGSALVLLLLLFLIVRGILLTQSVRSRYSNLIIVGAMSIMAFHVFVNVAMVMGMMPVTGLPLPFLSYGGSFALTVAMLMGLVLNAKLNRGDI